MRWTKLEPLILILLLFPAFAFAAKAPSDYKLRVAILSDNVSSYQPSFTGGFPYFRYRVDGRGNVADGPTIHAFYFQYDGTLHVLVTLSKETYLARWKQPRHEMELLVPNQDKGGKIETIDLQTDILEGVYVRTSQGLIQMSQADYQARQAGGKPSAPHRPLPNAPSPRTFRSLPNRTAPRLMSMASSWEQPHRFSGSIWAPTPSL